MRQAKKGLKIYPHKVKKDILICCFNDRDELELIENHGAWNFQGIHTMIERWNGGIPLEENKFNKINFWVQFRGVPPKMVTKENVYKLATRIGEVLQADWKEAELWW